MGTTVGTISSAIGVETYFSASAFVLTTSPSCFDEAGWTFVGSEGIAFPLGDPISSNEIREHWNPYQGTIRLVYTPYDASFTKRRTLFHLDGGSGEYASVYIDKGLSSTTSASNFLYFNVNGNYAAAQLPDVALGDDLHCVVHYDLINTVSDSYNAVCFINGEATTSFFDGSPTTFDTYNSDSVFIVGNNSARTSAAHGRISGMIIEDKVWPAAAITTDYSDARNSGGINRLTYAVTEDTVFAGPWRHRGSTDDYSAFGFSKIYNPHEQNIVPDGSMEKPGVGDWTAVGCKIAKTSDPTYIKYGTRSLKILSQAAANSYAYTDLYIGKLREIALSADVWIPTGGAAKILVTANGGATSIINTGSIAGAGEWVRINVVGSHSTAVTFMRLALFSLVTDTSVYVANISIRDSIITDGNFRNWDGGLPVQNDWLEGGGTIDEVATPVKWVGNTVAGIATDASNSVRYRSRNGNNAINTGSIYLFRCWARAESQINANHVSIRFNDYNTAAANAYEVFATVHFYVDNLSFRECRMLVEPRTYDPDIVFIKTSATVRTCFFDDVEMIEAKTIAPTIVYANSTGGVYVTSDYGVEEAALQLTGRDQVVYDAGNVVATGSGAVVIYGKMVGSHWMDGQSHMIWEYGDGEITLEKTSANKLRGSAGTSYAELTVSDMTLPDDYHMLSVTWDSAESTVSVWMNTYFSTSDGAFVVAASSSMYLGHSSSTFDDRPANYIYDKINFYQSYLSQTNLEALESDDIYF